MAVRTKSKFNTNGTNKVTNYITSWWMGDEVLQEMWDQ